MTIIYFINILYLDDTFIGFNQYQLSINLIRLSQNVIKVPITIFDHHPSLNPDFEYPQYGSLTKGLVEDILGKDSLPVLKKNYPASGLITSQQTFNQWFVPVKGVNLGVISTLDFQKSTTDGSKYSINNDAFFPIDNMGLDSLKNESGYIYRRYADEQGNYHNYHFCLHMQSNFYYRGTESFTFKGDDDVWLFINNKLVVDLGGIHTQANQTINFKDLGLVSTENKPVKFDFFYCERHTYASEIEIETELEFLCLRKDYCGICGGSGSECCNPNVDCSDNDPCTVDACPSVSTPDITEANWKTKCVHTPITCSAPDRCHNSACSNGTCVVSDVVCPEKPCSKSYCNKDSGCGYTATECKPADKCTNAACDPSTGACKSTPISCNDNNPCTIDSCDPAVGCLFKAKCQKAGDCQKDVCSPTGECSIETIPEGQCVCDCPRTGCEDFKCNPGSKCTKTPKVYSDGNLCTKDECVPLSTNTSEPRFTPIVCAASTDPCFVSQCDPAKGCVPVPINCDDGNPCSIDTCVAGKCVNTLDTCSDGNPCTEDHCNATLGACQHTPIPCNNTDICMVGTCSSANGSCTYAPKVCPDPAGKFCEVGYCDPLAGCIFIPRKCVADNPECQKSVCNEDAKKCDETSFSPTPYKCLSTAAKAGVIGGAAIAGIVIGGAVALGLAAFGGKKGYDYWKNTQQQKMTTSNANPLYEKNPNNGENPLYTSNG
ncbi:PA14 domain-containing protein [Cavenderia fasciculata]|uniref:PA14 domain-containing protein n=1 Tax=Cavenderia fasciculata TaxID=261658 RepID=F4PNQ5_CACFS|nr:PA14 domain-containing protein [Cavenderia fasciculata]EGG23108.1 PA14 domain-containing protein [Cavenderia fasciculata]|eukprot:XP_004360959.1 PA14 domain-containing protein [Cavenderia fasciculata]